MANSSTEYESLLRQLNDEKAVQMVPVIVYMTVLMVLGLLGNAMVCYFYGYKTKLTSNTLFIIGMAVFDLITCTVTIPLEIYDLRYFYMFYNVGTCKAMRFVTHFASVCSATILLAIAIDRYRRICKPFTQQYNLWNAMRALAISIGIAVFLAWPALVLYSPVRVLVHNDQNVTLYGSDCTTTRHTSFRVFQWVFNGIYLLLFIVAVVMLCALYYRVVKVLLKHSQARKRYSRPITADLSATQLDSNGTETSSTGDDNNHRPTEAMDEINDNMDSKVAKHSHNMRSIRTNGSDHSSESKTSHNVYSFKTSERDQTNADHRVSGLKKVQTNADNLASRGVTEDKARSDTIDQKTIKYTTVMISIAVAYIVSYLPYLVLAIWRLFIQVYEVNVLSDTGLVFLQIGLRSYMLNSAINPFLYGFFNSRFRKFFRRVLFPCCSQDLLETSTTSS